MSTVILRGGVEVENPLELALEFLAAYSKHEARGSSGPASFDESDLRLANRGGARISAIEIAAILERRGEIEGALRRIHPDASLADATSSVPWVPLTRLFDAFADIRGVGFSKMTKALHGKRPALIPMLDSVVQAYLTMDDLGPSSSGRSRSTLLSSRTSMSATAMVVTLARPTRATGPSRSPLQPGICVFGALRRRVFASSGEPCAWPVGAMPPAYRGYSRSSLFALATAAAREEQPSLA
jgi:hypothetical protein